MTRFGHMLMPEFKDMDFFSPLCRGAHEQQIWQVISREILNLSLNSKICISKNMALFLYVFGIGPCFQKCKFLHAETD